VNDIAQCVCSGNEIQAGHQYNGIQQILEGLVQLSALWQTPQTKYKALWGLQEYTRLASSLCQEATLNDHLREAAAIVVPALLDRVEVLLDKETRTSPPRLGGQWPKVRPLMNLPPPVLDRGYYYFGVLDCAAQLATLIDLWLHRESLFKKMIRIILISDVPEYRWKAVSSRYSL